MYTHTQTYTHPQQGKCVSSIGRVPLPHLQFPQLFFSDKLLQPKPPQTSLRLSGLQACSISSFSNSNVQHTTIQQNQFLCHLPWICERGIYSWSPESSLCPVHWWMAHWWSGNAGHSGCPANARNHDYAKVKVTTDPAMHSRLKNNNYRQEVVVISKPITSVIQQPHLTPTGMR